MADGLRVSIYQYLLKVQLAGPPTRSSLAGLAPSGSRFAGSRATLGRLGPASLGGGATLRVPSCGRTSGLDVSAGVTSPYGRLGLANVEVGGFVTH